MCVCVVGVGRRDDCVRSVVELNGLVQFCCIGLDTLGVDTLRPNVRRVTNRSHLIRSEAKGSSMVQ